MRLLFLKPLLYIALSIHTCISEVIFHNYNYLLTADTGVG